MNADTANTIPNDVLKAVASGSIAIDESIPDGLVEMRPSGERIPVDRFIQNVRGHAQLQRRRKAERQNRRRNRR